MDTYRRFADSRCIRGEATGGGGMLHKRDKVCLVQQIQRAGPDICLMLVWLARGCFQCCNSAPTFQTLSV